MGRFSQRRAPMGSQGERRSCTFCVATGPSGCGSQGAQLGRRNHGVIDRRKRDRVRILMNLRARMRGGVAGILVTAALVGLVVLGSRRLTHFGAALVGYTFANLF